MKKVTNVGFVIWAVATLISFPVALFGAFNWPINEFVPTLGFFLLATGSVVFCFSGTAELFMAKDSKLNLLSGLTGVAVFACSIFVFLGFMSKIFHWPGANTYLLTFSITAAIAFTVLIIRVFTISRNARMVFIHLGLLLVLLNTSLLPALSLVAITSTQSELVNAYSKIQEGLQSTNEQLDRMMDQTIKDIKSRADAKDSTLNRLNSLQESTDSTYGLLTNIYEDLVGAGASGHDRTISQRVMILEGRGDEVRDQLESFRKIALGTCDISENEITVSANPPSPREGIQKTWAEDNFSEVPLVAALAIIAKLQNDVRTTGLVVLECLKAESSE